MHRHCTSAFEHFRKYSSSSRVSFLDFGVKFLDTGVLLLKGHLSVFKLKV